MSEQRTLEDGRLHSSKAPAPRPPPKAMKYDPNEIEISGSEAQGSFAALHRQALAKQAKETSEPHALVFRKLEEKSDPVKGLVHVPVKSYEEEKIVLARAGETILDTFYGMFYSTDNETKEWKLVVDGFVPVCFVQEHGNANKPFKIIAANGNTRLMEFSVLKETKCSRIKAFVKWFEGNGSNNMFGVRFGKEDQAQQFYSALCRMTSTLIKTAELLKQPVRKKIMLQLSNSGDAVHHTKMSLIIKLPNKETTVMSVPGLITMSELFELICQKEGLSPTQHQLSLPKVGGREFIYEPHTALGSLKIREVSIIFVETTLEQSEDIQEEHLDDVESLLEAGSEEGKLLEVHLPSGHKKSFRVPLDMRIRNLVTYICKLESLNARLHSLQYLDFMHQFLDVNSQVGEIEVGELRLVDKRGSNSPSRRIGKKVSSNSSPAVTNRTNHSSGSKVKSIKTNQSSVEVESERVQVAPTDSTSKIHPVPLDGTELDSTNVLNRQEIPEVEPTQEKNLISNGDARRVSSQEPESPKPNMKPPPPYSIRPHPASRGQPTESQLTGELKSKGSFSKLGSSRMYGSSPDLSHKNPTRTKRKAPPPPRPPQPSNRSRSRADEQTALSSASPSPPSLVTPISSSASTPQGSPSTAPRPRHDRKRRAPARPPARPPAPSLLRHEAEAKSLNEQKKSLEKAALSLESGLDSIDDEGARQRNDRPPPIFVPPPPPDELPPPIEECENPECPLSDDDLHDTTWHSGFIPDEAINGYPNGDFFPVKETPSVQNQESQLQTERQNNRQRPVAAARREKTEKSERPEKFEKPLPPPPRQSSISSNPISPVTSPDTLPLKFLLPTPEKSTSSSISVDLRNESMRIPFVGESRSSSTDISSPENELVEEFSPVEGSIPLEPPTQLVESPVSFSEIKPVELPPLDIPNDFPKGDSKLESVKPHPDIPSDIPEVEEDSSKVESVAPPPDLPRDVTVNDKSYSSIEDLVVPPPPIIPEERFLEIPDFLSRADTSSPIPPPVDFASPPMEFASPPLEFSDESSSPKPAKRKLTLTDSLFPWLAESGDTFKAEIPTPSVEAQSDVVIAPAPVTYEYTSDIQRKEITTESSFTSVARETYSTEQTTTDTKIASTLFLGKLYDTEHGTPPPAVAFDHEGLHSSEIEVPEPFVSDITKTEDTTIVRTLPTPKEPKDEHVTQEVKIPPKSPESLMTKMYLKKEGHIAKSVALGKTEGNQEIKEPSRSNIETEIPVEPIVASVKQDNYRTPFDDFDEMTSEALEPDEPYYRDERVIGIAEVHEPVVETPVMAESKMMESSPRGFFDDLDRKFTELEHSEPVVTPVKGFDVKQEPSRTPMPATEDLKLNIPVTPEYLSEPPTPPMNSPPGSGYVSPTLHSPLCSPRGDSDVVVVEAAPSSSFPKQTKGKTEQTIGMASVPSAKPLCYIQDVAMVNQGTEVSKVNPSLQSPLSSRSMSPEVASSRSSPSSPSECTLEPIELPNPPPITVPPLRRYSDLATNISFVSSALKIEQKEVKVKESNRGPNQAQGSTKSEVPPMKPQASAGYKRPIIASGFRSQSWADIKNRQKKMEDEKKNAASVKASSQAPPQAAQSQVPHLEASSQVSPKEMTSQVNPLQASTQVGESQIPTNATSSQASHVEASSEFRNRTQSSPASSRPQSWMGPSTRGLSLLMPISYRPGGAKASTGPGSPLSSFVPTSAPVKSDDKVENTSTEVIALSKASEPESKTTGEDSKPKTEVVMREKSRGQPDSEKLEEKRLSVKNMTAMYGATKQQPEDSTGVQKRYSSSERPQQSPALRILEEQMSRPVKKYGISSLVSTLSSKPSSESKADSKSITNPDSSLETRQPAEKTKEKEEEHVSKPKSDPDDARKTYNVLFPKVEIVKDKRKASVTEVKPSREASKEPKIDPADTRKQYNVLFPKVEIVKQEPSREDPKETVNSETETKLSREVPKDPKTDPVDARKRYSAPFLKVEIVKQQTTNSAAKPSREVPKDPETDPVGSRKAYNAPFPKVEIVKKQTANSEATPSSEASKAMDASQKTTLTDSSSGSVSRTESTTTSVNTHDSVVSQNRRDSTGLQLKYNEPTARADGGVSTSRGSSLKILLAPQITDTDVVPRGRVAAMMASFKKQKSTEG